MQYNKGQGVSDGSFREKRFFKCDPDSALFVGLHRIRKCKEAPKGPPASASFAEKCGLKLNDRIVWMSDQGPEHGVVKWIGLLPDSRSDDDITVGVEFVSREVTVLYRKVIHWICRFTKKKL